jgi:energy-converting hydrogenase Eha subunit G
MINPANLPQTCGQCHVNAGDKFLTGPIHLTIEEREGKIVAIIRSFYLALIVLVIGGMVVHNGLDFIRKSKRARRRN